MSTMNRRQLLTATAGTGLGFLLSSWLERVARADTPERAADTRAPSTAPARKPGKAKHVILLWMNGGPSHIDTWDPKTGKTGGSHKAIKTSVPGVSICEHMPELARVANKLAIVRGMTSKEGNHQRAQYLLRTGYAPTPTVLHPSFAAWMSKRFGEPQSGLPAFVSLGGPSLGGGFFGVEHGPFVVTPAGQLPENVEAAVGPDRLTARKALLGEMEAAFAAKTGDTKVDGRRALYGKADRLMHADALGAFDIAKESESVRKAFGETPFGKGCLTAARLVGSGVRFVEVVLDGWDTHQDAFGRTKRLMGTLDPAMASLLAELERRSLLDETLVVWMGDFGRTPRINGNDGRDHFPAAFSAVLAGAGIRSGIVHGETDAEGAKVVKDAVTVPNFLATLAELVGLDPGDTAISPAGRPIAITDSGVPVKALLKA